MVICRAEKRRRPGFNLASELCRTDLAWTESCSSIPGFSMRFLSLCSPLSAAVAGGKNLTGRVEQSSLMRLTQPDRAEGAYRIAAWDLPHARSAHNNVVARVHLRLSVTWAHASLYLCKTSPVN